MPIYWRSRLARLWIALSAAWVAAFLVIAVGATRGYGFWSWFFDPETPGWGWLVGPPIALGIAIQIVGWMAWGLVRYAGPLWGHRSLGSLVADASPEPPTPGEGGDPATPR